LIAGTQVVQNLVALATYDVDETGYWTRLRWVTGLFFGVAFAAVELVSPIPNTRYSPPISAIDFAVGGPLFGFFFPAFMRRRVRLITAALYGGEKWIIEPPPPD